MGGTSIYTRAKLVVQAFESAEERKVYLIVPKIAIEALCITTLFLYLYCKCAHMMMAHCQCTRANFEPEQGRFQSVKDPHGP